MDRPFGREIPSAGDAIRTGRHRILCLYRLRMANITVSVDDDLKKRMENHPEIN